MCAMDPKSINNRIIELLLSDDLVRITLSISRSNEDLKNVYIRKIKIKNETFFSVTYRYLTNDTVENIDKNDLVSFVFNHWKINFSAITIFTTARTYFISLSKKGKELYREEKVENIPKMETQHNLVKDRYINSEAPFLFELGITDSNKQVKPTMFDKYKQINRFIEIVSHLLKDVEVKENWNIVDMGSGKGYLTFAISYYFNNILNKKVSVTGVELRKKMVDLCNSISDKCDFKNLKFVENSIQNFQSEKIDFLIALHACDTATDDAIFKGVSKNAHVIITAPCCHKELRNSLKGKQQNNAILQYGILKERQYEMVTDVLRAKILETKNYATNVFEFVSNEHTRKNIMISAVKKDVDNESNILRVKNQINELKNMYQIETYYLEKFIK